MRNKITLLLVFIFCQRTLLYSQSTKENPFENWSDEQYQQYEDSVRAALYPPVVAYQVEKAVGRIPKVKEIVKSPAVRRSGDYVPTARSIDPSKEVGEIVVVSGTTPSEARTYEIPIKVYPGVNGHQPNLALLYNSQQGNAVAGVGWTVSGLSEVSRGGTSIHYDKKTQGVSMNHNDAFLLDGMRLIKISDNGDHSLFESEQGNIKAKGYQEGNVLKYFDVFFPNGNKGVYGFKSNAQNQLCYPLTLLQAPKGHAISYAYSYTGNHYRIEK